jgi:DNA-binding transcriptional ArsR family regulator
MPNDIPRPIDPAAVMTAEQQKLTPRNEKRMRALLEGICDPTRIKIVRALRDTTLAASDLAYVVGRNRSVTSQHLRVLRELGAIVPKRKGNVVRYTLSDDVSGSIIEEAASVFDQLQPTTAGPAG